MDPDERQDSNPIIPRFLHCQEQRLRPRVWCLYCCAWHTHSAEPLGSIEHRVAHCYAPESDYRLKGGYMIQVSSRSYPEVSKLVKRSLGGVKPWSKNQWPSRQRRVYRDLVNYSWA
jgi:hypothetical protein